MMRALNLAKAHGQLPSRISFHVCCSLDMVCNASWPKVLPWCLAVMAVTYLLIYLREKDIVDMTISDATGHNFMSILVVSIHLVGMLYDGQEKEVLIACISFNSPSSLSHASPLPTIASWKHDNICRICF